jgi:hypothetical protein
MADKRRGSQDLRYGLKFLSDIIGIAAKSYAHQPRQYRQAEATQIKTD